jgi:xanthine dehydrogenase YagS FAD-binding subunit
MKGFSFKNAATIEEAVSLLKAGNAAVFAGGTDILNVLKAGALPDPPEVLVNIKKLPGLNDIVESSSGLEIGALVTLAEIAGSKPVRKKYKALAEAATAVASPQIRNMGTIGGNLCQEVQCWYWRRSFNTGVWFNCLRKGGTECFAATGDPRYHAIVGGKGCLAVCPSDTAVALTALNATIVTNRRKIPISNFYKVLGNVLKRDEIITGIMVPIPAAGTRQTFIKFALRPAIDFAVVSIAAVIEMPGNTVSATRIVLGGVSPVPYEAVRAEDAIIGKVTDEKLAETAAEAAVENAVPLIGPADPTGQRSSNKYKIQIARTLVKRAILSER